MYSNFCCILILFCTLTHCVVHAWTLNSYYQYVDKRNLAYTSQRRDVLAESAILIGKAGLTVSLGITTTPRSVNAAQILAVNKDLLPRETTVGEALRRSAANIPGYGPTDIFYPLAWQGTWMLKREDLVTETNASSQTYTYPVRFIQSVDRGAVVADRTFNELNYWEAARKGDKKANVVQSVEWTETNPNDLNIVFSDGLRRNVKVTKRATDMTETTVSSSEFQRILEDRSSVDGTTVPKLYSYRKLTKWKMVSDNRVEGIEIVYDMNLEGDADRIDFTTLRPNELLQPKLISKSRFVLNR